MDLQFSPSEATKSFNAFNQKCAVEPVEYLVWHALLLACLSASQKNDFVLAASIADISKNVTIHREKIRRALVKLQQKRLAKQIGGQWIFLTDGLNHEN